jgi:hypothetical protein
MAVGGQHGGIGRPPQHEFIKDSLERLNRFVHTSF